MRWASGGLLSEQCWVNKRLPWGPVRSHSYFSDLLTPTNCGGGCSLGNHTTYQLARYGDQGAEDREVFDVKRVDIKVEDLRLYLSNMPSREQPLKPMRADLPQSAKAWQRAEEIGVATCHRVLVGGGGMFGKDDCKDVSPAPQRHDQWPILLWLVCQHSITRSPITVSLDPWWTSAEVSKKSKCFSLHRKTRPATRPAYSFTPSSSRGEFAMTCARAANHRFDCCWIRRLRSSLPVAPQAHAISTSAP